MALRSSWLTVANAFTLCRLALVPFCVEALLAHAHLRAFVVFWLAVATDLADGRIARRRGEVTALGGLLDHSTDALFVASGLAALAWRGEVTPLLAPLVAIAFVQYALDSRALGGRRLRASALGRVNGVAYFVVLGTPVVRDAIGLAWPPTWLVSALAWLFVVSTLASMLDRALAWRRHAGVPGDPRDPS